MSQAVVDLFEPVQIDEEYGELAAGAPRNSDGMLPTLLQQRAVGNTGQRVVCGNNFEVLLAFSQCDLSFNSAVELDVFLPECFLQALTLGDIGRDSSK